VSGETKAEPKAASDEWFRDKAAEMYGEEGGVEIDEDAPVSVNEEGEGAYVQAWVWVPIEG
jgi:hypothetical protein